MRIQLRETRDWFRILRQAERQEHSVRMPRNSLPVPRFFRIIAAAMLACALAVAANSPDPFGAIPADRRAALNTRLEAYVKLNRSRDWSKLYDLVSTTGRGGVSRRDFVVLVDADHDRFYANSHDLLEFRPNRSEADADGYDIYGCGKARREKDVDTGIVIVHAVFEHRNWFFTGWAFTQNPAEACARLSDPKWRPEDRVRWNEPMLEIRPQPGEHAHADSDNSDR